VFGGAEGGNESTSSTNLLHGLMGTVKAKACSTSIYSMASTLSARAIPRRAARTLRLAQQRNTRQVKSVEKDIPRRLFQGERLDASQIETTARDEIE
jgi:hypothetical protein